MKTIILILITSLLFAAYSLYNKGLDTMQTIKANNQLTIEAMQL